ncbi:MAG: choice-of-anchor D domain-containing protein [Bdellovibrionota bacterium]
MKQFFFIYPIFLLVLCLFSCGTPSEENLRKRNICNPYNGTGDHCDKAAIKFSDLSDELEALAKQKITWNAVEGASSYEVILTKNSDCSDPIQSKTDLTAAETEIIIEESGEYYLCLNLITTEGEKYASLDSPKIIKVTESTRAYLSFGSTKELDFGTRSVNLEVYASLAIKNNGATTATDIKVNGLSQQFYFLGTNEEAGTFPGKEGTCTSTLAAGGRCLITIAYKATTKGSYEQKITVTYNDGIDNGNDTFTLKGSSQTQASLSFSSTTSYDYGDVATDESKDQAFTLTNSGETNANTITAPTAPSPFTYKGGSFPGTGGNCTDTLAGGASCTFILTFAPSSVGSSTAKLTFNYLNGAGSSSVSKTVTGNAVTP